MKDTRYLTFALCKGRLAKQTLELLEELGITCEEMKDKNSRKLIFVNEELKLKFFLSKGPDVPTYVEYGAADIGVVGKDTILEAGKKVHEVLDLGFGTMTALAIVICGNCVGYSTGMGNPFTTIIGQKICQLPLYSAMWYRAICFFLFYGITVWYILRYAKKIRKNPILSATYEEDEIRRKENMQMTQNATLSAKNKVVCVYVVVCFFFNIFGVIELGWDIAEMTGLFLVMSTGAGVLSGHSLTDTCKMFMNGARDILQGALVMCFARTIALLMTTSNTLDVFVYGISKIAGAFPPTLAIVGIFIAGMLLNFPINSGSGQMTATMPIMSPLADILHVSKQGAVLATQFGDGWSNTIYPTNASYMATMAVAKVNWVDWLKFQFPLHCIWTVVSVIMLIIAQTINIGPF